VVGLIPEGLGGLDVSWGEEGRVFVGHIIKDACCLCTLNKTNALDLKKQKKQKTVTVVRALHAAI